VGLQNRHEADVTNSFQILPNTFKEICEAAVRAKEVHESLSVGIVLTETS